MRNRRLGEPSRVFALSRSWVESYARELGMMEWRLFNSGGLCCANLPYALWAELCLISLLFIGFLFSYFCSCTRIGERKTNFP